MRATCGAVAEVCWAGQMGLWNRYWSAAVAAVAVLRCCTAPPADRRFEVGLRANMASSMLYQLPFRSPDATCVLPSWTSEVDVRMIT